MEVIFDTTNSKGFGTFKFQYSKYDPMHPEPHFIPKEKKKAEFIIGMYYSQFRILHLNENIDKIELNKDDSNKNHDLLIRQNSIEKTLQITRLTFTKYDERKSVAKQKSINIALAITKEVKIDFKLNVNIFPTETKDKIPLRSIKSKRNVTESKLTSFIEESIKKNQDALKSKSDPIWLKVDEELSKHFKFIVLNPIPKNCYSRFYGTNNVFINYDFNDIAYDERDIGKSIHELYEKKNNGSSEILLIWANIFELRLHLNFIVQKLHEKFIESSFKEVFLMTFEDNIGLFRDSLELWPIKTLEENNSTWPNKNPII